MDTGSSAAQIVGQPVEVGRLMPQSMDEYDFGRLMHSASLRFETPLAVNPRTQESVIEPTDGRNIAPVSVPIWGTTSGTCRCGDDRGPSTWISGRKAIPLARCRISALAWVKHVPARPKSGR
jgi:hypothetical protein